MLHKKRAFTLAEVLITLGIIGIVASMTIPTVLSSYQKQFTATKYQKAYAEISQIIKLAEVDNGSMDSWDVSSIADATLKTSTFANQYFYPYMITVKKCAALEAGCWKAPVSQSGVGGYASFAEQTYAVSGIAKSGYSFFLWKSGQDDEDSHVQIWIDVDGLNKGPGVLVKDVLGIIVYLKQGVTHRMGVYPVGAGMIPALSRSDMLSDNQHGCSKAVAGHYAGRYCGGLIQFDGWKISDDYPW